MTQEFHFKNIDFFYTEPENIFENQLILKNEEFIHLKKSLRKKAGEEIYVISGSGIIYKSEIEKYEKNSATCNILAKIESNSEPKIKIDLAISLLKNPSRFDLVLEKSTEIGVNSFLPFKSEYTISNTMKTERWKQITISAIKQSQRAFLPNIDMLRSFDEIINLKYDYKIIADRDSNEKISGLNFNSDEKILIIIGPEGGFSDDEVTKAIQNGFTKIQMGKTRLRSETAAIAAISSILLK